MMNQNQTNRPETTSSMTPDKIHFNWPIVGFLLLMCGIPGIPAILIVSLVLIGAGGSGELSTMINAVYFETPGAILLHGFSGALFFLMMPFQFSPYVRRKFPMWHRSGGGVALLSGMTLGLSGIWMYQVVNPGHSGAEYVSLVIMSLMMCGAFLLALGYIVRGNVPQHRRWMIRAVAITLAAVTPLFVDGLLSVFFGSMEGLYAIISQFQAEYGRLTGIVINLLIVEWVIHQPNRQPLSKSVLVQP